MKSNYNTIKIEVDQAASIAQSLYNIEGEISILHGESDFNFKLKTSTENYILKISRPDSQLEYFRFQQATINHINVSCIDLVSPRLYPDLQGNYISEIKDSAGRIRIVRLLSWVEGRLWSSINPIDDELLYSLGVEAGKLTTALNGFDHPMAHRRFEWDLAQAEWTYNHTDQFTSEQQSSVSYFQEQFESIKKQYARLRKGVIHNDINDNNIIVSDDRLRPQVTSIIDYGDAVHTQIINEVAITIAYAIMNKPDVLDAAMPVVNGYNNQFPLLEAELPFLYNLVAMRLIISVTKAKLNKQKEPENKYLLISEQSAWDVLEKWRQVNRSFALYMFRNACGFEAHSNGKKFKNWVKKHPVELSALFPKIANENIHTIDMSVSSPLSGSLTYPPDLKLFKFKLDELQARYPDKILAGGYLEPRFLDNPGSCEKEGNNGNELQSIHLGADFWLPAGTAVHAVYEGKVVVSTHQSEAGQFGGLIVLRHRANSFDFYILYAHLSAASIENVSVGETIKPGERIGLLGETFENGQVSPHLHFQVMLSIFDNMAIFPGKTYPLQQDVWASICPSPSLLFPNSGLEPHPFETNERIITYRKKHLGKSLSWSYGEPLRIVRGSGTFLIDATGRKYLDTVNNVAHVGHEHPRVVQAGQDQMAVLNTNTRYLHTAVNDFAIELLSTFPEELSVVHFVNSGSEANELALRMARTFSGQKDIIAVETGYHGNTGGCIDISSYKFDGKGGDGTPEHTHIVPVPDDYRGLYQGENSGEQYAAHVQHQVAKIQDKGRNVAGFICESIISCGGQFELPENYLKLAYKAVHKAGGVCIADEVQVGFGRVGSKFWGFQLHHVIPDIVTIGKPIGNGHPLAAVICRASIAEAFANGMEYFNTFGGNPVSCAIGREVLKVVREENLQQNAMRVGSYLKSEIQKLSLDNPIIGDVRGQGFFLGFELVDSKKNPLADHTTYLSNRMKDFGILVSTDGRDRNVVKFKPPMVFSFENANEFITRMNTILSEDYMQVS